MYKDIYTKHTDGDRQMNEWQGAWHLAKQEWRKDRAGLFVTALFIAYMLILTRMFYLEPANQQAESSFWMVDFIQLAIMPMLGFPATRTLFKAWRDDCYTRKIIQWRTLPISLNQLVVGRMIQITGLLAIGVLIYFVILYGSVAPLREQLGIGPFIGFVLIWFSYSVVIASTYMFWEQGYSGKIYMLVSCAYAMIYLAVAAILAVYGKKSISQYLIRAMADGNWWYTVVALVCGAAIVYGMYRLTCRRLQVRSFTR